MNTSARIALFSVLALLGIATALLSYIFMYGATLPASMGEVAIVRTGGETLGSNISSATPPEMFASQYFDFKVEKVALSSAKTTTGQFTLTKPNGEIVELFQAQISRGYRIREWISGDQGGVSVDGKYLDAPGTYTISGKADMYAIPDKSFEVVRGPVARKFEELFISSLGDVAIVTRAVGSSFSALSDTYQSYRAGYGTSDQKQSWSGDLELEITQGKGVGKLMLDTVERENFAAVGTYKKVGNVYVSTSNIEENYLWVSGETWLDLRLSLFDASEGKRSQYVAVKDAYLKKFPPDAQ